MRKVFDAGFGGVRLSPDLAPSEEALKQAWREWLALYNRLQVLPGTWLLESSGMFHGDYAVLATTATTVGASIASAADPWRPILELALEELHPGLEQLRDGDAPLPDHVGHELASASGEVIAEAELVWETLRLVALAEHQSGMRAAWEAAGWKVIDASEPGWPILVLEKARSEA